MTRPFSAIPTPPSPPLSGGSAAEEARRNDRIRTFSLLILALLATIAAARIAAGIVAPTVVAALFALTLSPVSRLVERLGPPPPVAAMLVVGACGAAIAGGGWLLMPSVDSWRARAPSVFRTVEVKLTRFEREVTANVTGAAATGPLTSNTKESAADKVLETGQGMLTDVLMKAPETIAGLVYGVFLSYLLLAERATLRRTMLASVRPPTRRRLVRAMRDMRVTVGRYLLLVTFINMCLGAVAALFFWWGGMPNPALFGTMVTVLNFMPYLGPLIANAVVFSVGVVSFPDPVHALYMVLGLASLNAVEGQLITPMAVGHGMKVGVLPVFLAVAFGAWLWGAAGALVAAPLLIVGRRVWLHMSGVAHS